MPWHDLASVSGKEHLALGSVVALVAILNVVLLNEEGYANTYYAAAVKNMLLSWHNFFFVAFDPGGFVAVDKPPLGLWIQTASARLFGFSGVSMLLPQALAGVLSVLVLYALVARVFGFPAGLLAAAALALTPIAVVDNRNNSSDSVLIPIILLAVWAVMRAVDTGRLRWLLAGAALVGLGFNVKEMEAYLVLPALAVFYLAGARRHWLTRLWHLLAAGFVVLIVSFAWIVAVDLTPASQRPYVSDSGTNSELSLALGYNGFGRLATGIFSHLPTIPFLHVKIDTSIVPAVATDIGSPSVLRLVEPVIGAQASWLLPLALVGLLAAVFRRRRRWPLSCEHLALLFWGSWLVTVAAFFSVARFYHLYYLVMLAPVAAALAGIGMTAMWRDYRNTVQSSKFKVQSGGGERADSADATSVADEDEYSPKGSQPVWWQGWLLPVAVLTTGFIQYHILSGYGSWNGWLGRVMLGAAALVAVVLVAGRLGIRLALDRDLIVGVDARVALAVTVLALLSLFIAPSTFAADSIANGNGGAWLPQAGPSLGFGGFGGFARGGPGSLGTRFGRFSGTGPGSGLQVPGRGTGSSARGGTAPSRIPSPGGAGGFGSGAGFPNRFARGGPFGGFGGFGGGGAMTFAGSQIPTVDPKLLHYLESHRGHARYLVATLTSSYASLMILDTGQPVMTLGGYQGWDRILTLTQLRRDVAVGTTRFFLLDAPGSGTTSPGRPRLGSFGASRLGTEVDANVAGANNALVTWVTTHCSAVPTTRYDGKASGAATPVSGSSGPGFGRFGAQGPGQLYDCAGRA